MRYFQSSFVLLALLLMTMSQAQAELRIEITESAGVQDKVPVAVVPFADEVTGLPVDIAKIVEDDLLRSGRFDIVPRNLLPSNPSSSTEVTFSDWRATNIEYLVIGSVKNSIGGRLEVIFELVDIVRQQRLLAYPPNDQGQVDYCLSLIHI